jgi:rubrerythrin
MIRAQTVGVTSMSSTTLKGTKTHQNLKDAFAGESQANRRYLYFAKIADVEGYPEVAGNFRDTAEGETGHAHGHLDYLKRAGDPATGLPIGDTEKNLAASVAGETHEYTDMYPGMARPPAKRASTRSPTGSRRSRRPRSRTPASSRRCSRASRERDAPEHERPRPAVRGPRAVSRP